MHKGSANKDIDMDYELGAHSELELFMPMQLEVKIPTRKEALTARAQFLALCWSLFLIGWTDGSTGPLLLRIQEFYDVSLCLDPGAQRSLTWMDSVGRVWKSVLYIRFGMCGR
jgi:hypothetical protein